MKRDWHPEELLQHWSVLPDERSLVDQKLGATKLSFIVLLKYFQHEGRFPRQNEDVPDMVVSYLARSESSPVRKARGDCPSRP